jgi:RND family efflux transporter MFP subunit
MTVASGGHSNPAAIGEPVSVTARVAVAERLEIADRTVLAGTVIAQQTASVSSRVMAMVTAIHVEMGDEVRSGQTLISIDPTSAEGQASQAQGSLAQAEAALTLARRNLERYQALAATASASELELDLARTQFDQAKGAVEQARGAVGAARSVARESRVVAPFAGRVVARLVEVGDLAAPGRPLATIESYTGRRLVVAVPESIAQAAALKPGVAVGVTLDAQPAAGEIRARVIEVSPGPDPLTHAYTVKIDLPVSGVAAGAAGRAYLSGVRRQAVRVPREALVVSGGLTMVVVRDGDGRAQSRVVTVGRSDSDGRIEVLSGLAGGETVALGLLTAPPTGARIEVRQ